MASAASIFLKYCSSPEKKYQYFRLISLIFMGGMVYSNTFNVPFSFDDVSNLHKNPVVSQFGLPGIKQAFLSRRAVGIISFQLNHFIAGWSLYWFHLVNLIIHVSTALIAYQLVTLLMITPYARRHGDEEFSNLPLPFFVALLFVTHPVQTQAVTYIVQRFSSLATLFYLSCVIAFIKTRFIQLKSGKYLSLGAFLWAMAAFALGVLALFTKEIAYTLPFAIILAELLFFRSSPKKIICLASGGLALVSAAFVKFALSVGSIDDAVSVLDEATRLQTSAVMSRTDYLFTQFRVIVTYIRLIFLPINQKVEYDYPLLRNFWDWRVYCSLLLIVLLVGGAVWMIAKSRDSYPLLRFISFGIIWFFVGLSIESSFIPIIDLVFEHRLYLPSFGAFTAISAVALTTVKGKGPAAQQFVFGGMLIIVALLAITTYKRNDVWKSEISLWADSVEKSPQSARAWHNLGAAYIKNRDSLKALEATVRSIELDRSRPAAWNNLGIILDLFGTYNDRFHRTSEMFNSPQSINDKVMNSWQGEVNNNLGLAYEILGNLPKAAENYRNAVGYNPSLGLAYYNLGIVSFTAGDYSTFWEQHQILILLDPDLALRLQMRAGVR